MTGKVYLVGAGPGDVGLLTLKGKYLLETADVVVYDHLVGRDILSMVSPEKKFINVGKISGHHPIPQWQINEILVEEAQKGQRVVRLKGGDPFLFGRGGEELEKLVEHEIPFEIVPGVTSPLAVPAYNGIPVTHRDYTSSLHIVTGHTKHESDKPIDYKGLVETRGTLVFLMGVKTLPVLMQGLLGAGMDPDMPAAILQEGTTAGQRRVVATVSTLYEEAQKADIKPPAIIVVGRVCELAEKLHWYEKLPLMGKKILLTRPRELMSVTAKKLRERGAEVLEVPAIEIHPIPENQRLHECVMGDTAPDMTDGHAFCVAGILAYQWIVFTSQAGVRIFFQELAKMHKDIRCLAGARFAVIGAGTGKELEKHGIFADLMPEVYDGESLGQALAEEMKSEETEKIRILLPRAKVGNQKLVEILETAGAIVDDVPIYETVYAKSPCIDVKAEMEQKKIDVVAFTSSSTVHGFAAVTEGLDYSKVTAACIGRQTAETAAGYGMKCKVAKRATIDSLVELLEEMEA